MIQASRYISIEGLEGAGKSTAISAIKDYYNGKIHVECFREPGGTPLAEHMRDMVKGEGAFRNYDEHIDAFTETMLFYGARNQQLINTLIPCLEKNDVVISDRCYLTGVAYQKEEKELVRYLSDRLHKKPDLIIYLDIDPAIGMERAGKRGALDRIEQRDLSFFHSARETYLEEVENNDFIVKVNANQSIENVAKDVVKMVENFERQIIENSAKQKFESKIKNRT